MSTAGSSNVIELHGNISRIICSRERIAVEKWAESNNVPCCPNCNSLLRPDVVWFGKSLPAQALHTAYQSAKECDVFFAIGTSAMVQPAASLPVAAINENIMTVEINPDTTPLTPHPSRRCSFAGAIGPDIARVIEPD